MTPAPDHEQLLAHKRWLDGLARQLVDDAHDAEDLVQDAALRALTHPPAAAAPGWLRTVLRHRLYDVLRNRRTRAARERAVGAEANVAPATVDVVAKAEAHRRLVAAVLALDEPYRSCVLLRFFENLPPRVIARRTATPVATVHSRLQRALAQLRARYAREQGDRWPLALAPLLPRPATVGALPPGMLLMHSFSRVLLAAAVLAAGVLFWNWPPQTVPVAIPATEAGAAAIPPTDGTIQASATPPGTDRLEITPADPDAPVVDPIAQRMRGRVLDVRGIGVGGVGLTFFAGQRALVDSRATSDLRGAFDLPVPSAATSITTDDARWSTVLAGSVRSDREVVVVVAPRLALGGRVVDTAGHAIAGAAVTVHMPGDFGADLGVLLDFSTPRTWRTECDADGQFHFGDVPWVAEGSLVAELGGFVPRIVDLPPASTGQIELVLERPSQDAGVIQGLVVDQWGAAVAAAHVGDGRQVAISDARGAFRLDLTEGRHLGRLVAVKRGHQPGIFEPPTDRRGEANWPARVVLQLGPAPRSLAGRVLRADGRPAARIRVWITDPLVVGTGDDVVLAETMLGGGDAFWHHVWTDADGAFRLDGLLDRAYQLRALDPTTLVGVDHAGVTAGRSDVELRLPAPAIARLRCRVVARDGVGLAGVDVRLQRSVLEVRLPNGTRNEWTEGQHAHTDAEGWCEFTDVPDANVEVFASGDSILFASRTIEPDADVEGFVVVAQRRMHLQVEMHPPHDRADAVAVLDGDGRRMLLRIMRGNASKAARTATLVDGRTQILSLAEDAATVVLLLAEREVARQPVRLGNGVTTVRF